MEIPSSQTLLSHTGFCDVGRNHHLAVALGRHHKGLRAWWPPFCRSMDSTIWIQLYNHKSWHINDFLIIMISFPLWSIHIDEYNMNNIDFPNGFRGFYRSRLQLLLLWQRAMQRYLRRSAAPAQAQWVVHRVSFRPKSNLRGGTRKVGKQERNRRKNEGERAGKKT